MVLKLLTRARARLEQVIARFAVAENRADDNERLGAHVGARLRQPGQQIEGRRTGLAQRLDPHRAISVARKWNRERRPIGADLGSVGTQRIADLYARAVDVNMELILSAPLRRIDRERH